LGAKRSRFTEQFNHLPGEFAANAAFFVFEIDEGERHG